MKKPISTVTKIRTNVFCEVAKWSFNEADPETLEKIPFNIIGTEVASYRENVFIERAIISERVKFALDLPLSDPKSSVPISTHYNAHHGIKDTLPIIDVIPSACESCDAKSVNVTERCKGCLARHCSLVCPVDAVEFVERKAYINSEKCIKCGKCVSACPYNAIVKSVRPCASVCGVDAIESDYLNRAVINHDKCVGCGQCMKACPFGAVADKSQIHQVITAIKEGKRVNCIIAPSYVNKFGADVDFNILSAGLRSIGFNDCYEVAKGADDVARHEANHFLETVGVSNDFLATSCCPAWKLMVEKNYSEIAFCVSGKVTPMIATGKSVKLEDPDSLVVFIGPCTAKKLEAKRDYVSKYIDFVLTYEELQGIIKAKDLNFDDFLDVDFYESNCKIPATKQGRGFPYPKGIISAITHYANLIDEDRPITLTDHADGLFDCKKMLALAQKGKRNGYLLEGLACKGGCVGGSDEHFSR